MNVCWVLLKYVALAVGLREMYTSKRSIAKVYLNVFCSTCCFYVLFLTEHENGDVLSTNEPSNENAETNSKKISTLIIEELYSPVFSRKPTPPTNASEKTGGENFSKTVARNSLILDKDVKVLDSFPLNQRIEFNISTKNGPELLCLKSSSGISEEIKIKDDVENVSQNGAEEVVKGKVPSKVSNGTESSNQISMGRNVITNLLKTKLENDIEKKQLKEANGAEKSNHTNGNVQVNSLHMEDNADNIKNSNVHTNCFESDTNQKNSSPLTDSDKDIVPICNVCDKTIERYRPLELTTLSLKVLSLAFVFY